MPFSTLEKFNSDEVSINLHYVDRCNQNKNKIIRNNYELRLNKEILPELRGIIPSLIEKHRYKTIRPYTIDIDSAEIDCIYKINAGEVPFLQTFLSAIRQNDVEQITSNLSNNLNTNMVMTSYTINDNRAICFTSYNPMNLFKGKKIYMLNQSIEITTFKENLISIPDYVDCVYIESLQQIIIFQKKHFETIFKYKEEYRRKANEALKLIKTKNIIQGVDLDDFKHILKDKPTKKLANIFIEGKIDKVIANFDKAINANERLPEEKRIKIDKKHKKFILDKDASDEYVETLLSLLNLEPHQNIITEDLRLISDQRASQLSFISKLGNFFNRK